MSRAEHNEMVQAFPSNRTNETLRLGVLPWAAGSRENLLYSERLKRGDEMRRHKRRHDRGGDIAVYPPQRGFPRSAAPPIQPSDVPLC